MFFAYGYKCGDLDFLHTDVPQANIMIDHDRERRNLSALINDHLRAGADDVLYLIRDSDIPPASAQRAAILAMGVEIRHMPEPAVSARPVGRPAGFVPSGEKREILRRVWLDPANSTYGALKKMTEEYGDRVSRGQAYRAFGPRLKQRSNSDA